MKFVKFVVKKYLRNLNHLTLSKTRKMSLVTFTLSAVNTAETRNFRLLTFDILCMPSEAHYDLTMQNKPFRLVKWLISGGENTSISVLTHVMHHLAIEGVETLA